VAVRVFVTGATGVLGRSSVIALLAAGHEVSGLARSPANATTLESLGVCPVAGDLFDEAALAAAFAGHDAVCNLARATPAGVAMLRPSGWRMNDRVRRSGATAVARAAAAAGVGRIVQESISFLYADGADDVLTEESPLSVTRVTESAAEAESRAQEFGSSRHEYVVLRFGQLVGDDPLTRWRLDRTRHLRPSCIGDPDGWVHVVHVEDAGAAVAAAATVPAGVYNVGAAPLRRREFFRAFAEAQGVPDPGPTSSVTARLLRPVTEHATRSHRVCSDRLVDAGWKPRYDDFSTTWLQDVLHVGS
jgi:nucleoside-diphosphate-sugar epimerase